MKLSSSEEAAVLLMSLPPELAASVFNEMGGREVMEVTSAICQLPQIESDFRREVADRFLRHAGAPGAGLDGLEELCRRDPAQFAEALRRSYLRGGELRDWSTLARVQQAAAVIGTLPPDGARAVFVCMEADVYQGLVTLLLDLPFMSVTCRRSLRLRFLYHAHRITLDDSELDEMARQDPQRVAQTLRRHYLGRTWQAKPAGELMLEDSARRFVPVPAVSRQAIWRTPGFGSN